MTSELGEKAEANEAGFLERDFCIDIDDIEIEFVGRTPRLTGRIEINLQAPGGEELRLPIVIGETLNLRPQRKLWYRRHYKGGIR